MNQRLALAALLGAVASIAAFAAGDGSALAVPPGAPATAAAAGPTLEDYRRFRTLSIDLLGRIPTREELAEIETPGFDLNAWIDRHLDGPAYVERLERIYMDALRLEVGPAFQFTPPATTLHRETLMGPDKKPLYVYYRQNQRRARPETDGEFCFTKAETGLVFPPNQPPKGTAVPVKKAALEANTVLVHPWWLYRDYRADKPTQRYGTKEWERPGVANDPGYQLLDEMLVEPDGKTPTVEVRVCKEEAQTAETGHVYASGRPPPVKGAPAPFGRLRPLPGDDAYAKLHKGQTLSCRSTLGLNSSIDCGCGIGLEHCMPGDKPGNDPRAFSLPNHVPLGLGDPIASSPQTNSAWHRFWWSQEAVHFLDHLFADDRDFREIVTARYGFVNGPLAQFYRSGAPASCCNREKAFGMQEEMEPLFDPRAVPASVDLHDTVDWAAVAERSPDAAGILTMPAFLTKYSSRRARGAAIYSGLLCKTFGADHAQLMPSTEPNLMIRQGCSSCHAILEPLAAYFTRVEETSWVFLPAARFPVDNAVCRKNPQGKSPGFCDFFYDGAFADGKAGILRGAYASAEHAEAGPAGAAKDLAAMPELADCAVERVTSSFLGRPLRDEDAPLREQLRALFVAQGYRMRPLVSAVVRSAAYQRANNESSTQWREGGGK
jgi:Protein of unknown function (DUF1585)